MHPLVKRPVELLLARSGAPRLWRRGLRPRALVLAYHNVVPEGAAPAADASLHLPVGRFREQLDSLMRTHDVVPLPDLLSAAPGARARPRAAITFDDAYQGMVVHGAPELAERGLPATLFVAPGRLGRQTFWWDAFRAPEGLSPEAFRESALHEMEGREAAVREWAERIGARGAAVPEHARSATEEELRAAVGRGFLTLGSHSWSHPNLERLAEDELREELAAPLRWLRERFPERTIPWVAYPYGLASDRIGRAAAAAGYAAGLRVSGGAFPRRPADPFALPRLNVAAGVSAEGFLLRTAGILAR